MRITVILMVLALAACSGAPHHELVQTSDKDPVWQLNPDKWTDNENALVSPPSNPGAPTTQVFGQ